MQSFQTTRLIAWTLEQKLLKDNNNFRTKISAKQFMSTEIFIKDILGETLLSELIHQADFG